MISYVYGLYVVDRIRISIFSLSFPPSIGQSSIESLLGHIGINDVEDVVEAVAQCLRTNSDLDPHKVPPDVITVLL